MTATPPEFGFTFNIAIYNNVCPPGTSELKE
jgi:hypothetical protein